MECVDREIHWPCGKRSVLPTAEINPLHFSPKGDGQDTPKRVVGDEHPFLREDAFQARREASLIALSAQVFNYRSRVERKLNFRSGRAHALEGVVSSRF